jgi:hypothetical protein
MQKDLSNNTRKFEQPKKTWTLIEEEKQSKRINKTKAKQAKKKTRLIK